MKFDIKNTVITSLFVLCFFPLFGQSDYQICRLSNDAFIPGEKLEYALYYNWNFIWVPAGVLSFYIEENEEHYLVQVIGRTHESYNWFFKVEDRYECIMEKSSFMPQYFKRDIEEGNYRIWNEINYDYEKDSVTSTVRINKNPPETFSFSLDSCVMDLLSFSYKLRNIDIDSLKQMDHVDINLIFDEKIYNIPVRYLGQEKEKMIKGIGRMDLYKISPDLIAGNVFREGQKMVLWVSQDGNRIPVLIESPIKVGSLKAVLKKYENLKYPLHVKLKK